MKLSIVTINYNDSKGLRKTMESVFAQTCKEFEYIVIDGASTDGSVDVLQASSLQAEGLAFTWVSEKDSGIYNAMNKGVRKAIGEYVLMLNSGDYLVDEHVIEQIMPKLKEADIIQGNMIMLKEKQLYRTRGYGRSNIDMIDVMKGLILHQAAFCKRSLFEQFGYFDENYKVIADTKFFMSALGENNASFRYVDIDITNYDCNGISAETSGKWYETKKKEYERLRNELYPIRLQNLAKEGEKKINLYNKLHSHRWIWNLTMFLAHMHDWIYGRIQYGEQIEKIHE